MIIILIKIVINYFLPLTVFKNNSMNFKNKQIIKKIHKLYKIKYNIVKKN